MENLPDCGMTAEQRAGSFSTVPNYDNDDEAWSVDDIGELQVEVRGCITAVFKQDVMSSQLLLLGMSRSDHVTGNQGDHLLSNSIFIRCYILIRDRIYEYMYVYLLFSLLLIRSIIFQNKWEKCVCTGRVLVNKSSIHLSRWNYIESRAPPKSLQSLQKVI